jgi:F-type H+-transporting ATPase subunit delta
MVTGSLARRYARAVLTLGETEKIATDLRVLAQAMKTSEELVSSLTNPAIRRGDRRKVLDALLTRISAHAHTKNLVYLLLDGERLASLPAISRELEAMLEARGGRITATITSATPLDAKQIEQITAALEKLSNKKVTVTKKEDPALLGGVVAKLGDTVYDGSLRTQLRTLKNELTLGQRKN